MWKKQRNSRKAKGRKREQTGEGKPATEAMESSDAPKGTSAGSLSSRRCTLSDIENCNAVTKLFFLESRKNISVTGGANLVSCGAAGYVRFWNTHRSKLLAEFDAHSGMGSIVMTVDQRNRYLITGDPAGWVKIWDIEEYCLTAGENTTTRLPPLIRLFQPHDNCVTDLETCVQNNGLFILSSSTDCSVVLSDISGVPLGVFGQEGHWRIGNYIPSSFVRGENTHQMEENDIKTSSVPFVGEDASSNPVEQAIPVAEDKDDLADMVNIWDNTILGKKYKEKKPQKGRKYAAPFDKAAEIKPTVVFRSLNIEALKEMPQMSKLNFLLPPDKYFGETSVERSCEDLKLPTLSATLKGAFNEKNLFPKEILDREKKSRQLLEEICNKGRIKNESKPGKLKGK